jgi:formylglycine-generating enzyme required for sulfatase activity
MPQLRVYSIVCLFLLWGVLLFGQSKPPKNMVLIPKGTFKPQASESNQTITIAAFWMSNEITNKNYRKFVSWLEKHPNDSLTLVNWQQYRQNQNLKKSSQSFTNAQVLEKLSCKTFTPYGNFFTDICKKQLRQFAKYPVVDVSFNDANFYCAWKTQMEQHKSKAPVMAYRLPFETEWEYAVSNGLKENIQSNSLLPVKSGKPNNFGVYDGGGNVSEWVVDANRKALVKGGSWKRKIGLHENIQVNPDSVSNDIGFRMVQSFVILK